MRKRGSVVEQLTKIMADVIPDLAVPETVDGPSADTLPDS